MKKIIITVMVLIITLGLLGMGTSSVFAEQNIIDPGKLSLNVFGKNTANEAYLFDNIKPGDSLGWDGSQNTNGMTWTVKNTGTLDGSLRISIEDIKDNGCTLSAQIMPQLWINNSMVSEALNLADLPAYQRVLASGEEIKVDIAWKFKETAGNECQGATTELNVKFYITAPSPSEIIESSIKADGITESPANANGISVLALTGTNPIVPIIGITLLLIAFITFIISLIIKRKIRIRS